VGAREHFELALATCDPERDRELAFQFGQDAGITARIVLALVLWPLGEVDRARSCAAEAVLQATQSGHIPTLCFVHAFKCVFEAMCREVTRCGTHADALVGLSREHSLPLWLAFATVSQRWARWRAGNPEVQAAGVRESLAILYEMGNRVPRPLFAALVGEVEAGEGRIEVALDILKDQLVETDRSGQSWYDAELHRMRGELLLQYERPDAAGAESDFMRAIEIACSRQTRTFELRAALSLAKLYQATGRGEAALDPLTPAVAGFTEGPELPEVAEANRLLASIEQMFGAA
jgi:predicted ATPase